MRATIMIRRQRSNREETSLISPQPVFNGEDATLTLCSVRSITAVRIEEQYGDRALLSYESSMARINFELVDAALQSKGMKRLE